MARELNEIEQLFVEQNEMSELMVDREKIETKDIIEEFPKGITITRFNKVLIEKEDEENDEFYVFLFAENDEVFAFSGYVLKKFFDKLIERYGSEDAANDALNNVGGIKVVLESSTTKKKQPITIVKLA